MNINCIICSDLFTPVSEIYSTTCGHIFHYTCLIQWLERSRTCPQCRNKCTEKTIHRIYFNFSNNDTILDDPATLQNKLDNLQFQIRLKQKDVDIYIEKYKKFKKQNELLREEVKTVEGRRTVAESAMFALQDQVKYFKEEARGCRKMNSEVIALKAKLRDMENLQLVTDGTKQEVDDMLRNNLDPNALSLMVVTLKKELLGAVDKKNLLDTKLKRYQNHVIRTKTELSQLTQKNSLMQIKLDECKLFEMEKEQLKNKIKEYENRFKNNMNCESSPSLARIVNESPIPLGKLVVPKNLTLQESMVKYKSPSVAEKVESIMSSDSPYLPLKSSSFGIANFAQVNMSQTTPKSIPVSTNLTIINCAQSAKSYSYDGLGGQEREEIFSKTFITGSKRPASKSASQKFKKLAPTNKKTKISAYMKPVEL